MSCKIDGDTVLVRISVVVALASGGVHVYHKRWKVTRLLPHYIAVRDDSVSPPEHSRLLRSSLGEARNINNVSADMWCVEGSPEEKTAEAVLRRAIALTRMRVARECLTGAAELTPDLKIAWDSILQQAAHIDKKLGEPAVDTTGENWLYRRLREASERVETWSPEKQAAINYTATPREE